MAVVYDSNGGGANAAGAAGLYALTVSYPATVSANDLLIAHMGASAGTIAGTNVVDTPTGWTLITSISGNSGVTAEYSFWKLAAGTEGGTTQAFTGSYVGASPNISGIIERYTGNQTSGTPVESAATNSGNSSTPAPASVTTSVNGGLAVFHLGNSTNRTAGDITGETGGDYAEAYADYTPGSSKFALETQTAAMATAGTISGGTCTLSASAKWVVICFGIKPSAGGATAYNVTLSPAAFVFTLQTLSAKTARFVTASPAAFVLTAQSLTSNYGRQVTLSRAAFVLTPQTVSAKTARKAVLSPASLALTVQSLTSNYGRQVALAAANFVFTPQALSAKTGRKATLSPAGFALTLQSLSAKTARKATLSPASFLFTPLDLTVVYTPGSVAIHYTVTLSPASFVFTPAALTAVATIRPATIIHLGPGWGDLHRRNEKRRHERDAVKQASKDDLAKLLKRLLGMLPEDAAPEIAEAKAEAVEAVAKVTRPDAFISERETQAALTGVAKLERLLGHYESLRLTVRLRMIQDEDDDDLLLS